MANYNGNATPNQRQPNLARKLHERLLCDLILRFIGTDAHILKWRHQFRIHCNDQKVIEGSIDGHFDYLEEIGKLKIGDYEILKEIFDQVNKQVSLFIDDKSTEIEEALQNNQNRSKEEKAAGTNAKNQKGEENFIKQTEIEKLHPIRFLYENE
eukprot:XP_011450560.1 PREDICTED: uncharacterized protein LOC105344478 [Crassostrea gigas]